jgi:hypothetical protein
MSEAKRMAGPYEITHAIHIGDREIVLGENPADTDGTPVHVLLLRVQRLFCKVL